MLWAKGRVHRNYFDLLPRVRTHSGSADYGGSLYWAVYLRDYVCCSICGS